MRLDLNDLLEDINLISADLGPLAYGMSFASVGFFDVYDCYPWDVKGICSSTDKNIQMQFFSIIEDGEENIAKRWGEIWPEIPKMIESESKLYCPYMANQYPIDVDWPPGRFFSLIDGRDYLYYFLVLFRRLFLSNEPDSVMYSSGEYLVFNFDHLSEFLSCIDNVLSYLSVRNATFLLNCLQYIKENTNTGDYSYIISAKESGVISMPDTFYSEYNNNDVELLISAVKKLENLHRHI